jgi:hypothetical protein
MLRPHQINSDGGAPRLRFALSSASRPVRDVAWALEDRLLWRTGDLLRRAGEAARWPFERIVRAPLERLAWPLERWLLWPLEERFGDWGLPLRAGLAVLALAGGVAALAIVANGGGHSSPLTSTLPAPAPAAEWVPSEAQPAPVLRGAPPDFTRPADSGQSKATASHSSTAPPSKAVSTPAGSAKSDAPAAPAALKVAHRFADAFVLYETGQTGNDVRAVFGETATPRLSQALLRRPPRLPANVKVPQAKVVNVVPGPRSGSTYMVSVSLLRVGVTSELRVQMQRDAGSGEWRVTDVLG